MPKPRPTASSWCSTKRPAGPSSRRPCSSIRWRGPADSTTHSASLRRCGPPAWPATPTSAYVTMGRATSSS
uniref:Uncharacterized protein n=1 Tax=Zea mays TaxID=4577 RepID=B4FIJ1_MAIZE|nr:unknown [Zea mays]